MAMFRRTWKLCAIIYNFFFYSWCIAWSIILAIKIQITIEAWNDYLASWYLYPIQTVIPILQSYDQCPNSSTYVHNFMQSLQLQQAYLLPGQVIAQNSTSYFYETSSESVINFTLPGTDTGCLVNANPTTQCSKGQFQAINAESGLTLTEWPSASSQSQGISFCTARDYSFNFIDQFKRDAQQQKNGGKLLSCEQINLKTCGGNIVIPDSYRDSLNSIDTQFCVQQTQPCPVTAINFNEQTAAVQQAAGTNLYTYTLNGFQNISIEIDGRSLPLAETRITEGNGVCMYENDRRNYITYSQYTPYYPLDNQNAYVDCDPNWIDPAFVELASTTMSAFQASNPQSDSYFSNLPQYQFTSTSFGLYAKNYGLIARSCRTQSNLDTFLSLASVYRAVFVLAITLCAVTGLALFGCAYCDVRNIVDFRCENQPRRGKGFCKFTRKAFFVVFYTLLLTTFSLIKANNDKIQKMINNNCFDSYAHKFFSNLISSNTYVVNLIIVSAIYILFEPYILYGLKKLVECICDCINCEIDYFACCRWTKQQIIQIIRKRQVNAQLGRLQANYITAQRYAEQVPSSVNNRQGMQQMIDLEIQGYQNHQAEQQTADQFTPQLAASDVQIINQID